MTSVLHQPKTVGFDGVSLSTLRDFSRVKAAGGSWVSLYLGGSYAVRDYAIEAAWAAGLGVMLNYERAANDAKNGYPAGKKAAETALTQARALGFRGEAPLPFSAADEHFSDLAGAGLDYHRALVDVLAPHGWVGGAYGFKEMLELLSRQAWWPDDWPLWHWGGDGSTIFSWTWVKQGPGGSYFDQTIGLQVDRNRLYKPMKFWSGYGPDPEPPKPKDEDEVFYQLFQLPTGEAFGGYWDGRTAQEIVWLDGPTFEHYVNDEHYPVRPTTKVELKGTYLIGQLPPGFDGSEFKDVATRGEKGDKGDPGPAGAPGPAPHGTFPATVTIT